MSGSRVLDGISGDSTIRIEHAWIETLHIVATACLAFVTLGTLFRQMGGTGWLIAAIAAMIVLLGMFVARSLSALIGDLYRQMQYRERFLVFLLHMGLVIVPWVTRMATLPVALMGLLVVLSFQCIDKLFVARLQALLWFIMLLACGGGVDPVPWWLCVGFGVLMLLSVRLAHVAFRLQRHDRGDLSMPLSDMVLRSFWRILPVGLVGWLAWEVASRGLTPREFVYTVRPLRAAPPVGAATLSFSQLFWFSLAIIGIIIGLLVCLNLLDKLLRKRQASQVPVEEVGGMSAREARRGARGDDALAVATGGGPRQRILNAYRHLSSQMGLSGRAPRVGETAASWLGERGADPSSIQCFDLACYSPEEPSEVDADRFVAEAHQLASREVAPPVV